MTAPRDPDRSAPRPRLGDSTPAIRAAARTPEVHQRPTSARQVAAGVPALVDA